MKKNITLLSIIVLFVCTGQMFSQIMLDNTFGTDGKATFGLSLQYDGISSLAVQPDGKIISCVFLPFSLSGSITLMRLNTDGSLDTTFGTAGYVSTSITHVIGPHYPSHSQAIKLLNDGKILVTGMKGLSSSQNTYNFALARYNPDGSPDAAFGNSGIVETDFNSSSDIAYAVETQSDGKIIIAGQTFVTPDTHFGIVRYNSNGSVDSSFGTAGKIDIGLGLVDTGFLDIAIGVKIQSDNKIVIGGNSLSNNGPSSLDSDFTFLRLNADGSEDSSFGNNGRRQLGFGTYENMLSFVLTPDDQIIAWGYTSDEVTAGTNLIVKLGNGDLDTSFGSGGKIIIDSTDKMINGILLLSNNKLLLCGGQNDFNGTNFDYLLMCYNPNGTLDTTFDGDGIFTIDLFGDDLAHTMAVQPDNKIVIAGSSAPAGGVLDTSIARVFFQNLSLPGTSAKPVFSVYPNPVGSYANLDFHLDQPAAISVDLIDPTGKRIASLLSGKQFLQGNNSQTLEFPGNLANGVYFLNISDGRNISAVKIIR